MSKRTTKKPAGKPARKAADTATPKTSLANDIPPTEGLKTATEPEPKRRDLIRMAVKDMPRAEREAARNELFRHVLAHVAEMGAEGLQAVARIIDVRQHYSGVTSPAEGFLLSALGAHYTKGLTPGTVRQMLINSDGFDALFQEAVRAASRIKTIYGDDGAQNAVSQIEWSRDLSRQMYEYIAKYGAAEPPEREPRAGGAQ